MCLTTKELTPGNHSIAVFCISTKGKFYIFSHLFKFEMQKKEDLLSTFDLKWDVGLFGKIQINTDQSGMPLHSALNFTV